VGLDARAVLSCKKEILIRSKVATDQPDPETRSDARHSAVGGYARAAVPRLGALGALGVQLVASFAGRVTLRSDTDTRLDTPQTSSHEHQQQHVRLP
jgi:hypothetical protein